MYTTNGHTLFKVITTYDVYANCYAVSPHNDVKLQTLKDFLLNNSPHGITHEVTYKEIRGNQKLLKAKKEKVINLYGTYINIDYLLDCFKMTGEKNC